MIVPHYVNLLITGARADTRIAICRQRAARCNGAAGGNCGCEGCGGAAAAARYSLWPSLIMQVWYHHCRRSLCKFGIIGARAARSRRAGGRER